MSFLTSSGSSKWYYRIVFKSSFLNLGLVSSLNCRLEYVFIFEVFLRFGDGDWSGLRDCLLGTPDRP